MRILVIGGQGFIGNNLVLKLLEEGHQVTIFTKKINNKLLIPECKYIMGDFVSIDNFKEAFKGIDVVYHLISTTLPYNSNSNIPYDIESNIATTVKVLKLCVENSVDKIIFTSSGGTIYGEPKYIPISEEHPLNPVCSYGISKLAIEKYLFMFNYLYGLDYTVLRIANPYGPYQNPLAGQGVIGAFLGKALRKETIEIWGDGSVRRDYIFIEDVVEALCFSLFQNIKKKVFNIGSGNATPLNELVGIIEDTIEEKLKVVYKEARDIDVPLSLLDIARAKEYMNWKPKTSIEEGISKTWDWYKRNINLYHY